jgi:large subunit ribosomal protein L17
MKAGFRHGDNAAVAVIEFVERDTAAKGAEDRARHAERAASQDASAEATA